MSYRDAGVDIDAGDALVEAVKPCAKRTMRPEVLTGLGGFGALPEGVTAVLQKSAWPMPPLFAWLQQHGGVAEAEIHRVFNCGIGMTVIVAEEAASAAMRMPTEAGERIYRIGRIEARAPEQARTLVI